MKLDEFTLAYIECALWSTNDESNEQGGEPLDKNYGLEDIAPDTLAQMVADCKAFQEQNAADLEEDNYLRKVEWSETALAGHDFWLTREGHGAGFWDGYWSEPAASRLTEASEKFGGFDLYLGDDKKIYH